MEEQKPRDIKVEPQKEKIFPFKVQMNGSIPSTFEIGGLNAPAYELAEGHITGNVQMKDGFPIENVQIHTSVSIEPKNLERLLLWLRWKTFDEYEEIRLQTEERTSAIGLSMRTLLSGSIQYIDLAQEQSNRLPALDSPPDFK